MQSTPSYTSQPGMSVTSAVTGGLSQHPSMTFAQQPSLTQQPSMSFVQQPSITQQPSTMQHHSMPVQQQVPVSHGLSQPMSNFAMQATPTHALQSISAMHSRASAVAAPAQQTSVAFSQPLATEARYSAAQPSIPDVHVQPASDTQTPSWELTRAPTGPMSLSQSVGRLNVGNMSKVSHAHLSTANATPSTAAFVARSQLSQGHQPRSAATMPGPHVSLPTALSVRENMQQVHSDALSNILPEAPAESAGAFAANAQPSGVGSAWAGEQHQVSAAHPQYSAIPSVHKSNGQASALVSASHVTRGGSLWDGRNGAAPVTPRSATTQPMGGAVGFPNPPQSPPSQQLSKTVQVLSPESGDTQTFRLCAGEKGENVRAAIRGAFGMAQDQPFSIRDESGCNIVLGYPSVTEGVQYQLYKKQNPVPRGAARLGPDPTSQPSSPRAQPPSLGRALTQTRTATQQSLLQRVGGTDVGASPASQAVSRLHVGNPVSAVGAAGWELQKSEREPTGHGTPLQSRMAASSSPRAGASAALPSQNINIPASQQSPSAPQSRFSVAGRQPSPLHSAVADGAQQSPQASAAATARRLPSLPQASSPHAAGGQPAAEGRELVTVKAPSPATQVPGPKHRKHTSLAPLQTAARSLLVNISYTGQREALTGPATDGRAMAAFLDNAGFGGERMILSDADNQADPNQLPTKDNILQALRWVSGGTHAGEAVFVHYSGHGVEVRHDGEPGDYREALLPQDFRSTKPYQVLQTDEIHDAVRGLVPGAMMVIVCDCAHSGSMLDLPYTLRSRADGSVEWRERLGAVQDDSMGALVVISCWKGEEGGGALNALTTAFIQSLGRDGNPTFENFVADLQRQLQQRAGAGHHVPQISSNKRFSFTERFYLTLDA